MPKRRRFPWLLVLLPVLLVLGGGVWLLLLRPTQEVDAAVPLWTVARGPLRVTVLEGGSLEALESHTVVSKVEGQAAILFIVEEGLVLTEEDVEAGRIIVQLDSAGIEEKLERQKIDLASARAAYENAASNLEIQRQQNASDIRKAELAVRFALLDLSRYVGSELVDDLLDAHQQCTTGDPEQAVAASTGADEVVTGTGLRRLILTLLASEVLEGEAKQKIRQLDGDIGLAEEEYKRAQVDYDWSTKLREKGYVSLEEEEADRIALERRRIALEQARTAREQFAVYDFPKEVERLLSDLVEAEDQLSRTVKRTRSAEAKALAESTSRKEQFALQEARQKKLKEQLASCVIRAEQPGLVVYASSGRRRRWDRGERIQEGATVRERQPIIEIPNLARIGIKADIHESMVERVKAGQTASAVVDALPDQSIRGVVESVAPLPNPAESWFNPDRKVYATTIRLEEVPDAVRPGMSAKVEILVADLKDVITVPVQAVTGTADDPVVWVVDEDGSARKRAVVLGLTNDRFIQVESGLAEGDVVLLSPPRSDRLLEEKRRKKGRPKAGGAKRAGGEEASKGRRPSGKRPG